MMMVIMMMMMRVDRKRRRHEETAVESCVEASVTPAGGPPSTRGRLLQLQHLSN